MPFRAGYSSSTHIVSPLLLKNEECLAGAGCRNRTGGSSLEGWHITTIQIPRRGDYTMMRGVILRSMYLKFLSFSRHYPVLALVTFGMIMAAGLQLFGQT